MADDLAGLSLVEAAEAVRTGETTSVALLQACLANVDAANAGVNATIWVDRAGAMAAAEAADAVSGAKGKLHGLPLAHKDMYYQAGRPCTCGSAIRRDFVPETTATVIERMAAAGAYSFAGLNMAEFAQNPTGHNAHYGDCHNPWNLPYITGGSSSGSGAAVAARFTYAALGSDTGGSIRLPAAACGVVGLKPTQTRVSRAGGHAAVILARQRRPTDPHCAGLRPGHGGDRRARSARPDQQRGAGTGLRGGAGW